MVNIEPSNQGEFSREDRDLLITLNTEMRLLREDIKDMKNGNSLTLQDHENRLRFIERYMWMALGVLAVGEVVIKFYFK